MTLGTPLSLEERIEELFKTHEDLTINDIAKLIKPSKFTVEQVKQVVQSMFFNGKLQYHDEHGTYELVEEEKETPVDYLDRKLLEYITKFPGKSPRELETVGAAYLGYKRKPVVESLQHLLATGKVIMNDSLKVEPSV